MLNKIAKKLSFEQLEHKRLLAIVWANELDANGNFNAANGFAAEYVGNAQIARDIVNRAIDDWDRVINSFDYAVDNDGNPNNNLNNTFTLEIFADQIAGRGVTEDILFGADGRPFQATITLDDSGGGTGWFFDTTPLDDAEFTAIANPFQASFVDATTVGQARQNDFYRTVVHEIGHALGIRLDANLNAPTSRLYDIQIIGGGHNSFSNASSMV